MIQRCYSLHIHVAFQPIGDFEITCMYKKVTVTSIKNNKIEKVHVNRDGSGAKKYGDKSSSRENNRQGASLIFFSETLLFESKV